ncbi:MAG: VPDSG-CTERM sorting domain-containing protein [Verrucomicrobiales bacterium]|nr:VPDSG-CTERM sorting domain-containing protein [Planctomycetota bacterium]MCP5520976.1 VPDSG-CTERM sorting domain-containing protein [Verrucomicrobiales bacterium]
MRIKRVMLAAVGLAVGTGFALGIEVTVYDGQGLNGATAPWAGQAGLGVANEDNETEPGTYTGDAWDLEALWWSGGNLSVVGTYDFLTGMADGHDVPIGDLFIGEFNPNSPPDACMLLGDMDYYVTLNIAARTYNVWANVNGYTAVSDISPSTPWKGASSDSVPVATGVLDYLTGVADPFGLGLQTAVPGVRHNVVTLVGLGDYAANSDLHLTYKCGNDEIDGHVPDGGLSLMLLGLGVTGLAAVRRRTR